MDPSPAREAPCGHGDGLPLIVIEGPLGEPLLDQLDELAVAQGIPNPGSDLVHRHLVLGSTLGGDADHGGDDHVDWDHVDDALGHPRELLQEPSGIRDDDWLRHAETSNPTGGGLSER